MNIKRAIRDSLDTKYSGASCLFVPLNWRWAVKAYTDEATRNRCYERQRRAAEHKLGPDVRSFLFEVEMYINIEELQDELEFDWEMCHWTEEYKGKFYCYITEIVELVSHDLDIHEDYMDEIDIKFTDDYQGEIDEACLVLHETLDFNFIDNHVFNWGFKRGKLIPVDFGA
jgi:hypothetical protein